MISNSIPSIAKDAPLMIDQKEEGYVEASVEHKGKLIFIAGCLFGVFILISSWLIFIFWLDGSSH
ncbi:MAG: hypothetical protein US53_C0028G0005 [Candidatus Woesebacteria bacterium GW2011_GWA1_37_7]|uniref:Uncharacterized protein n=1 Tax=Candidatus Woesebacteria bacterium GW2011_GWA1_37_7 TaxID=1618545 RepID=A0A0G0H4K1_9BACT|nr:MAG: hypothetical protein US53_C0028G0005 [Candidatus Woesebacteria bacterium GW2011_GWA1_37_7]